MKIIKRIQKNNYELNKNNKKKIFFNSIRWLKIKK